MKTYQYRDLSVIESPENLFITACDSSGGVGEKPQDQLKVPAKYVAIFASRVCLFELLSCGCKIIGISNVVSGEMEPTGKAMIQGIQEELRRAGIDALPINGSTEENFKTTMTAFGIFMIGTTKKLRITPSVSGDLIICIGKPKMGASLILENDPDIVSYSDLYALRSYKGVKEIVPCGSKGILYEAKNLGAVYRLNFILEKTSLDILSSSGPATTVIASISKESLAELKEHFKKKLTLLGEFFSLE